MKFEFETKEGKKIEIEKKGLAEQANGEAWVRCGGTLILATAVMSKESRDDLDFFPLTVEYQEKYYAGGKIKGSRFVKRETRPSDEAICNARLIDRSIRPLFPDGLGREVQVVATVLSWDAENDPDVLSLLAASSALTMSDIPWNGPIAVARVCKTNGKLFLNPTYEERKDATIDIVFAGAEKDGEFLANMIEGEGEEASEEDMISAFDFASDYLKKLVAFQKEMAKKMGIKKAVVKIKGYSPELETEMRKFSEEKLSKALYLKDKTERSNAVSLVEKELCEFLDEKYKEEKFSKFANLFLEKETDRLIHENILKYGKRPDGRKIDELRNISGEVGILPRTHGSGLFLRGQTKSLSILTLGSPGDQQLFEGMEITGKKRFMHHYNFPPYCSGEVQSMRGPGRREIGHGMLAEKALFPLIPDAEKFPYTIRVVSEILSSNGSSSMASVSSSSLALMDAGVPIKRLATGIAIGLIQNQENGDYKILTDIQGPEDHYGDMDFKVAGTRQGITAIQMDVKINGISREIMEGAFERARKARFEILDVLEKVIPAPRPELSPFAPRMLTLQINPEKIREVIGTGGKIINEIIKETGAAIDIEDSGQIFITAESEESANKAMEWIKNIVREVQVGEVFEGKVERIMNFGAFVEILPGQDGMIHISKLSNKRVERVEDIVKIGDSVSVRVIEIDDQGRINLALIKNNSRK